MQAGAEGQDTVAILNQLSGGRSKGHKREFGGFAVFYDYVNYRIGSEKM